MQGVLTEDVRSSLRGRQVYGRRGDRVKVIADRHGVLIVEGTRWVPEEKEKHYINAGKHRYPVRKSKLKTTNTWED